MIQARALGKRYARQSPLALADVDLDVAEGETVGLLGPNGAGKTTLLALLATVLPPTRGTAVVAGASITENPARVRERVGYAPQRGGLYPELTVAENVRFLASLHGVRGARAAAARAIDRVGMTDLARRRAGTLSGGERQRASLAGALVHAPRVLLLDEPATGLDPAGRERVWRIIRSAARDDKVTVLVSTHDLEEAAHLCDRVLFMSRGRVVDAGPAADAARFRARYTEVEAA